VSIFARNNNFNPKYKVDFAKTTNYNQKTIVVKKKDNSLIFSNKDKMPPKPYKDAQFFIKAYDDKGKEIVSQTSYKLNNPASFHENNLSSARNFAIDKMRKRIGFVYDGIYRDSPKAERKIARIEYGWTRFSRKTSRAHKATA
jgi:hypothetical protein